MLLWILFISCSLLIRVVYVFRSICKNNVLRVTGKPLKTMFVLGSGGHTSELINLIKELNFEKYYVRDYIIADTDKLSHKKVENLENNLSGSYSVHYIRRSREVGQSYFTSVFSTFTACYCAFMLVLSLRPNLILCNGPGTCVPICIASLLLRIIGIINCRVVFIESICRVKTLSFSGKLLYYFVDIFIVQWPQLCQQYKNSVYIGRFY